MTETVPGGPTQSTADIEHRLMRALNTIRENWPDLVEPASSGGSGAKSTDEVTALDRRISLRHEVTLCLNGWARVIVEERDLSHGLPLGNDTLGLVEFIERWARWFSGHEAAPDAVEELASFAAQVKMTAHPARREWVVLGDCPFVVGDWFCAGQVRAYPTADRLPFCTDCGQEAVVEWWMDVLAVEHLVDRAGLPAFIRSETGRAVSRFTVDRWIRAGRIHPCGTDAAGGMVFDRGAVAYALSRRDTA